MDNYFDSDLNTDFSLNSTTIEKDEAIESSFKNNNLMVLDICNNNDEISRGLKEYWEKNFDLNLEKLKKNL